MDNVTQQIQNAASTMLRACRETGNWQMSLVLRDKDEKPVAGVFCVNDAELTEIIENAVTLYEERQKAATQNISETLKAAIARFTFTLEHRGKVCVLQEKSGGCRPATPYEVVMWKLLQQAAI